MASRHHVTYDSADQGGGFKVHTTSGLVEFKPSKRGLHSLNMAEHGAWQDDPAYACDNDNGDLKT